MNIVSKNLSKEVPSNIVKGASLEKTVNDLLDTFGAGEQRNAELINRFFDQAYFKGGESLIDKLSGIEPNLKFDDIKQEKINLAVLLYNNWMWDFRECLNNITNEYLKRAFIKEIHDKVEAKIGTAAPYGDFNDPNKCGIPGDSNVLGYFDKVISYLKEKEGSGGTAQKTLEILKEIDITNENINNNIQIIAPGNEIPAGVNLSDPSIPADMKNSFDTLLSFEIGKEADRTVNICKDIQKNFHGLLTNTFPAINTIVGEDDEFRYDEEKLGDEYKNRLEAVNNNTTLSEKDKKNQIDNLKREFYLKYLKSKNAKIGNTLQQLYENDFDYSKIDNATLKDYIDKVANIRFRMLVDKGLLNDAFKVNFGNIDSFERFYKDLADPSKTTINLSDVNILGATPPAPLTGNINIPVQKKIVEGKNEWLKNLDEFGKNAEKSYDALPIEYTINKEDFDREVLQELTIEDKEKMLRFLSKFDQGDRYEIKGEEIGNLIYLYFVINSKNPLIEMDLEKQKEVEDVFGKAKNSEHTPGENSEENEGNNEGNNESNEEDTAEKFKEEIEKLGQGKFENGSEIWLPMCDSKLPGGGYGRVKIKISDVDMVKGTFKGAVYGGELELNGNLEGNSRKFKMNKEFFDKLNEIIEKAGASKEKIWLLPNPDNSDFNSFKDKLGGKLGSGELAFPPSGATWTGDKFMQKIIDEDGKEKEVEVKYFGAASDDKSVYKVEYNPIRKTFTVSSSFNGDEKGKNGKSEKKRFSYKRDMDWNNFLIFFTQKGLVPQTEAEANSALARQEQEFKAVNGGKWTLNWFSINNIKNGFKNIFGAIKKKIDDYDKSQTEKFQGIVEGPILNALSALPLPPSIKYAIGERQQEIYNEELNGAWKEIEGYLKVLQSDGRFADTFETVPAHVQTIYGKSYQKFITDLFNKGNPSKEESRKAAALLLANFEKGGSPFRGLTQYENKGLWVKVLLGDAHYQQFLRDKAACIRDRDLAEKSGSEDDKKGLNEQLATCEMDYIINNIRGAYPKLPGSYFPSHEKPGINGDDSTNYIPNPSKRLLSETFANKLEDAKKGRFTKGSVEDTYTKNKSINRFAIMEDDFSKCGSARYKQGAGALRRMIDLASSDSLKNRVKKHFLTYLLSGVLDVNCDPGLKKQVYGWAKPISFVPGMLVKKAGVAENIAILLDEATGDFSKNVSKYFHKNKQHSGGIDFKGLQGEIDKWLTDEKMKELDDYFSKLPMQDFSNYTEPQKSVLEGFRKSLIDEDVEEFDRGVLDNPTMVNNGLLTNINVVSDRLRIDEGEFKGKDSDDIANKKDFWKSIKKSVENLEEKAGDPKTVNFVLNKYFTWFGINSAEERQNIRKWINTAYFYKNKVGENGGTYNIGHKTRFKDDHGNIREESIPVGKIDSTDITKILLYGLEGNVRSRPPLSGKILPTELKDALDEFQKFFNIAFNFGALSRPEVNEAFKIKSGNLNNNDIFLLGGRDVYKEIARKDDGVLESDDTEYNGNFRSLPQKKKKSIWRSILRDDDKYINPHMENIEKILKRNRNTLTGNWKLTTSGDSDRLSELQERLAA